MTIKAPTAILIADPFYIERMEETKDRKEKNNYKKLIYSRNNIPKDWIGEIIVKELEDDECPDFTYIKAVIAFSKSTLLRVNKEIKPLIDIIKKGTYFKDTDTLKFKTKGFELGCDTARFDVSTNHNFYEFHTGADGFYGYAHENFRMNTNLPNKKWELEGIYIELVFDSDLFTVEDIQESLGCLFEKRK